jgi:hypothetical protein
VLPSSRTSSCSGRSTAGAAKLVNGMSRTSLQQALELEPTTDPQGSPLMQLNPRTIRPRSRH